MRKTLLITAATGALLALGAAPAMATEAPPAEVNVLWVMPAGGTPENVTWPQTLADPLALACGVWYQSDWYLASEAPLFTADGILDYKEDWGTDIQKGALRWSFVYGGDCPPVIEEPPVVVPPVEELSAVDTPVTPEPTLANTGVAEDKFAVFSFTALGALALGCALVFIGGRGKKREEGDD